MALDRSSANFSRGTAPSFQSDFESRLLNLMSSTRGTAGQLGSSSQSNAAKTAAQPGVAKEGGQILGSTVLLDQALNDGALLASLEESFAGATAEAAAAETALVETAAAGASTAGAGGAAAGGAASGAAGAAAGGTAAATGAAGAGAAGAAGGAAAGGAAAGAAGGAAAGTAAAGGAAASTGALAALGPVGIGIGAAILLSQLL